MSLREGNDDLKERVAQLEKELEDSKEAERSLKNKLAQQNRTIEALCKEESLHKQFFLSIQAAVVRGDENSNILEINPSFSLLFGYSPEEVIGKNIDDLLTPDSEREVTEKIRDEVWEGKIRSYDAKRKRKDGSLVDVSILVTPLFSEGKRIGAYAIYKDISVRQEFEDQLRKNEFMFRKLAENMPFGFSIMHQNENFEYFNKTFTEIFGYTIDDVPDKKTWFNKAYPNKEYQKVVTSAWYKDVVDVEKGKTSEKIFSVCCKDKKQRTIHFRNIGMEDGRQYLIYEDITDKKKLESQIRQIQKMEAIGSLAGGIAHDFNNILSAIIGYTELSLLEVSQMMPAKTHLAKVLEACNRARALVNQILTFSRQREEELRPLQLAPLIKETVNLLRASLPSTIEIRQDIRSDAIVNGDFTQLYQVLMNLCANAGHAMSEKGGILGVNLKAVYLDKDFCKTHLDIVPGRHLILTVSDTGCGIAPEIMDRIFDPFFTTKGEGEGTGMGLSVVHGIVRTHGGSITVYSDVDHGTVFRIYLPVVEASISHSDANEKVLERGRERILFVDDEEIQADLGKQILERLGYKVTTKTSSLEALALFKKNPLAFDLVVTDLTMPIMTGDKLAQELISLRPDIPIILCTGFSRQLSEERALEMGIQAYIMKPMISAELSKTIRDVLDSRKETGR